MGTQTVERRTSPPYLPFKTFLNFIDLLHDTAVPQRIDSSVMSKYPGSIKAQLRAGLGYIGAIDDHGLVQPSFKALVKARGTDAWREEFKGQFLAWYKDLLGDLHLETATMAQLKDRFKAVGAEGSVIVKAARFFLAGLDEGGIPYSPHFKMRGALTGGMPSARNGKKPPRTTTRGRTSNDDSATSEMDEAEPREGFNQLKLTLRGGNTAVLMLPEELTESEWKMLDSYVRMYYEWDEEG